tara:strand:+ start:702 stop:1316 length:615 start_codon:yes stop_codon:yes gene_type:complete
MVIGKLIEVKFLKTNKNIFWIMWTFTLLFLYSIWIFLEAYYNLRLSSGIEGTKGKKGLQGTIGLRGKCNYPSYEGPGKHKDKYYQIDANAKNLQIKVGPLKKFMYSTMEWITGKKTGQIVGNKINGKPIDFRKCKKMCNTNENCKSFYYTAKQNMDKKTGDTVETKHCVFYNKNCKDAGDKCYMETLDLEDNIDKDMIGLYEKK